MAISSSGVKVADATGTGGSTSFHREPAGAKSCPSRDPRLIAATSDNYRPERFGLA